MAKTRGTYKLDDLVKLYEEIEKEIKDANKRLIEVRNGMDTLRKRRLSSVDEYLCAICGEWHIGLIP